MNSPTRTSQILAAMVAIFLTTMSAQAAGKAHPVSTAVQVLSLRSAYSTLASANHNYGNHRALAMQAIAEACSILGSNVSGDGKGGEWQFFSDFQLHQAQATIQLVRVGIPKGQQPRIASLLDTAINEINLALKVH